MISARDTKGDLHCRKGTRTQAWKRAEERSLPVTLCDDDLEENSYGDFVMRAAPTRSRRPARALHGVHTSMYLFGLLMSIEAVTSPDVAYSKSRKICQVSHSTPGET